MIKPSYVITLSVNGAASSSVWNSESPLEIGHPFRWIAEKTDDGIRVRNVTSESALATREVTDVALQKGASIELPEAEKSKRSGFVLAIRPVVSFPATIKTHGKEIGELRVYALRGDWTISASSLDDGYTGYALGQRAFAISRQSSGGYQIKVYSDQIRFGEASLAKGENLSVTDSELTGSTISTGEFLWRFANLKRVSENPIPLLTTETPDPEALTFKRSLKAAGVAFALFALLALIWPRPDNVTPITPQFAKMLFKKPVNAYATAAASGHANDISFGSTPSPKPRGSSRKKEQVAHVIHQAPGQAHPSTAKTVAHAKPSRQKKSPTQTAQAKPVVRPVSKPATRAVVKSVARAQVPARRAPTPMTQSTLTSKIVARGTIHTPVKLAHEEQNTQLAKTLADPGFMNASHGLVKSGMTKLMANSGYANGQDAKAEAKGMFKSGSSHGGSLGGSDSPDSRSVEVASIGGNGGLFGGNSGVGYGRGSHANVSGQGKSFVSVDPGKSEVDEGLTKEQVGAVIHAHMSEIRYCYEAAQLRDPDLAGKLSVAFVVGAPGTVNNARLAQVNSAERALGDCLVGRLSSWQFPHPRGGVNVAVNYPFIFKTLGR